ncbi:MAG: site-specific integrase [Muribaculaceae bacterium]|nr:site-specific integrase [Muribaculaceae bacterium]
MERSKEPIKLRRRTLKSGNVSLYLDIYINGERSYEYLNLYLVPEKKRADKDRNKETLRLADAVRAQRVVELQNGRFGFDRGTRLNTNFLDYYRMLCDKRRENMDSHGNWDIWKSVLKYLERYCRPNTTFRDVTREFVQGFRDYLDKATRVRGENKIDAAEEIHKLSAATKQAYFNRLRACINQALQDGIITRNPLRGVAGFKVEERERVYLTLDEVRAMAAAECRYPILRRSFLFSCLTGLRKSDIEKLKWSEVRQEGEFTRIVFRQKKTGGQEYIDINPQAASFMGDRGNPDDRVFAGFSYSISYLNELKRWAIRAGITKDITFHSGRHTFAVMMLDLGADIYTVQKLLGHKEIHTTQIYAKVMDKKKQEAAMLIPPILPIGE